ncbi:MAG: aldehyde ferredoxin oxidoreductase C-terminal domain-containing protein, partial [Smithellaceae bacterium]|nr:aldehyde ferredoxin oxidoreductase C-terminal domain-containing protein [Smithellaceae bacterium]
PNDYMDIGERIQTTKQAFNVKQGIAPKDFTISARALGMPPLKTGANKGRTVQIDKFRSDYWDHFGWDRETGIPKPETLARLGIVG